MKMIENRKESILRFFRFAEKLNIIYYQYIHQLVEMYEIVDRIVLAVINELIDEFFGAYIQHHFILMHSFHFIADCLNKMRFAKANPTINYQWVEGISSRFFSNC